MEITFEAIKTDKQKYVHLCTMSAFNVSTCSQMKNYNSGQYGDTELTLAQLTNCPIE